MHLISALRNPLIPLRSDQCVLFAAAAVIKAITALVTGPPNLVGFDFADLRLPCIDRAAPCSGQGEAAGPDRKKTNRKMDTHEENCANRKMSLSTKPMKN